MPANAGSASRWGPLFGMRASAWADTWEGPGGWGTLPYRHVLERADVRAGIRVLDCGCGAGRFARMAADRGASVAGIDASAELIAIASERSKEGDFRVGDIEALPWDDDSFDLVTGFSAFQFADDKVQALREAGRVTRGAVVVVIPTRAAESGVSAVFRPVFPLLPDAELRSLAASGMFALSEPGKLEEVLGVAALTALEDSEIECPIAFEDIDTAERAFIGAGPTQLAIRHSDEATIAETIRAALGQFVDAGGRVVLPAWYRAVTAQA
jgi:SAM-dependent methyltransferase